MFIYVVKKGDTLYSISRRYRVPVERIIDDNAIMDPNQLVIGQSLVLRPDNFLYYVQPGDDLTKISKRFGTTIDQILAFNEDLTAQSTLKVGTTIHIVYDVKEKVKMEINGYCYPTTSMDVIQKTLPYLTYISIFSNHIKADGTITEINDTRIINEALRQKVAPLLSLTNINEEGSFDSDLAKAVLSDPAIQDQLIANAIELAKRKKYYGVNFDFEYIYPENKEDYNAFLAKATKEMHAADLIVLTAVAPKTSSEQQGLLYTAHDYAFHGKTVDRVIIMTYEWGYTYGPAMPVAPIDRVEEVIQYATSVIPSKKILMGVPNYGYDFEVPFKKGVAANSISNTEAVELAAKVNAKIEYEENTQTPTFTYFKNKQQHRVYFEDARSILAKVQLAIEYDLGGLNYWTIKDFFLVNWLIISYYIDIVKVIA